MSCLPKAYIHHYYHGVSFFEKLKDQSCNAQNRRYGEMANHLFDTYKNTVMPHRKHMLRQNMTWRWQQCVHIHHQNIYYHIGNVFCVVLCCCV